MPESLGQGATIESRPPGKAASFAGGLVAFALRRDARCGLLHAAYGVFLFFTLFMAFHHVPWRDEAAPWLFARDYPLSDLLYLTQHEGHPLLWFLCVYVMEATGMNYLGMVLLNWAFSAAAVGLLFYRSALPLLARLAVAFAPVMVLEIAFTARDYAIAVLLSFWAAVLYPKAHEKPLRFSVVLALLANTNLFATAVFAGLSFQFLLEQAWGFGTRPFSLRPLVTRYLAANAVLLVGAVLLVLQLAPISLPGDPFPDEISRLTPDAGHLWRKSLIAVFLLPLLLSFFARGAGRPRVWGGWVIIPLAVVPVYVYGFMPRHLFMVAMSVAYFGWIYLDSFIDARKYLAFRLGPAGVKALVTVLAALAAFASTPEHPQKLLRPPYDSRDASAAIIRRGLDRPDTVLVVTDPFRAMPLLLFLKNIRTDIALPKFGPSPQAYAQDAYVGFMRTNPPTLGEIRPLIEDVAAKNPAKTIVVVATGPQSQDDPFTGDPAHHLEPVYHTPLWPDPEDQDESYAIYILR